MVPRKQYMSVKTGTIAYKFVINDNNTFVYILVRSCNINIEKMDDDDLLAVFFVVFSTRRLWTTNHLETKFIFPNYSIIQIY